MLIHSDCRHFRGDRPCHHHKDTGAHCDGCDHYEPVRFRILIIKLDATGDVLRTTSILHGLKEKYPSSHITWLTMKESLDLFLQNPYVDTLLDYSAESFLRLGVEAYDLVINLDASPRSAMLAEHARGKEKLGFGYHTRGYVYPFNEEARRWFEMGIFDDVKRANTMTYQEIALDICRLKHGRYDIVLNLSLEEKGFAAGFARRMNLPEGRPVIGLNTGAGGRWKKKKWTIEGYLDLIGLLAQETAPTILLYGGPLEKERNRFLMEKSRYPLIDTGCGNSLRQFISLVDLSDIVVTSDSLALHIAAGLGKKVVALFGPTSSVEIDLYGRGAKVSSDLPCLSCYRHDCEIRPDCMESISAAMVMTAIKGLL
ncbi:MAG: glycosyltransferase family 9 protein [Deltaproteobacteria bacterium]|nr:glycosyltransferase family 9 protein [Deltaproteobacteria bacterium]